MGNYNLTLDIGGTNTKLALTEGDKAVQSHVVATPDTYDGMKSFLTGLGERYEFNGAGIAVSGVVDGENLCVLKSSNVPVLEELDFKNIFKGHRLKLLNDAEAACLGEAHYGAGRAYRSFLMITLGTAIGSALYISDRIKGFERVIPQELSHIIYMPDGRKCPCGKKGCLQMYASTDFIRTSFENKKGYKPEVKEIFSLAKDADVKGIIDSYVDALCTGVLNDIYLSDTNKIILSGGIVKTDYPLLEQIEAVLRAKLLDIYCDGLEIVRTDLYDMAALMGMQYALEGANE